MHRLVIETLDPLADDRKCFRMVNGVLVEGSVKDVLPTLKTNSDGLKQVLEEMLKQYKSKQAELDTWKVSAFPIARPIAPTWARHSCIFVNQPCPDIDQFACTTEEEQHPGCAALSRATLVHLDSRFSWGTV